MNIQIFGTKKCNDTKKAERFFKERGIKYQYIDMKEKGNISIEKYPLKPIRDLKELKGLYNNPFVDCPPEHGST